MWFTIINRKNVKVKFVLEQAMKAKKWSKGIALLFNRDTKWGWVGGWLAPRRGSFTPGKETQYLLYRKMGGPQGRFGQVRKIYYTINTKI